MPLVTQRIARGLVPFLDPTLTPARRTRPERIVLGVRDGHRPSDKPPVRIFLGSERNQFRAERVFIWSVEKHRDPGRIYEIHLLKGLKGYISGFWITGFTNYRFAIPHFCDYAGRAIYNDVDQVWLTDPAELFDRPMDGKGFLSINDHDTSVMLVDCQRMAGVWNREAVTGTTRKRIEARARAAGLWGPMPGRYNARDKEYEPGDSACVHFTTLHTQPWRPVPESFVYDDNPTGNLWFDLEEEADRAGFLPVTALRPSSDWPDFALRLSSREDGPELTALLSPREPEGPPAERRSIRGLLEHVPDADLPWVLERLFARSRELDLHVREPLWIRAARPRRNLHFWIQQLQLASRLHPRTRWRFRRRVGTATDRLAGGPLPDGPVVVLSRPAPRLRSKSEALGVALARRTGRELVRAALPRHWLARVLAGLTGRGRFAENAARAAILVASGRSATRAARRLAARAESPPALVLVGRHAGPPPEHGGVVVSMAHHDLPPHPHRVETLLGFGHADAWHPSVSPQHWEEWVSAARRVALLIGRHPEGRWRDEALREVLTRTRRHAVDREARLLIVTAPDAELDADVLRDAADDETSVYVHAQGDDDNPYGLALERASALVVAGGSPGVLADALAAAAPVWLARHRARRGGLGRVWTRTARSVADRAFRPSYNKRGSIRPQQGRTYLSARLLERGWVTPPNGLEEWQALLVERGLAAWLGDEAVPSGRYAPETEELADRVLAGLSPTSAQKPGRGARRRTS